MADNLAGEQNDDADDADAGACTPTNEPNDDAEEDEPDEERDLDTDDDDDGVFDTEVDEAALRSEVKRPVRTAVLTSREQSRRHMPHSPSKSSSCMEHAFVSKGATRCKNATV